MDDWTRRRASGSAVSVAAPCNVRPRGEDPLDDFVLKVSGDPVPVLGHAEFTEAVVQARGFLMRAPDPVTQAVRRDGDHRAECGPQDHPPGKH